MYLVPIDEHQFVNPNNVATLLYEGPNTTRIVYTDGRTQDRVEIPIQKLADILNGEAMRYIITQDEDDNWWCDVPGESLQLGHGDSPEAAFQDAKFKWEVRNNTEASPDVELPFEQNVMDPAPSEPVTSGE